MIWELIKINRISGHIKMYFFHSNDLYELSDNVCRSPSAWILLGAIQYMSWVLAWGKKKIINSCNEK